MHIYLPFPFICAPLLINYHTFSVTFGFCLAEGHLFTAVQCKGLQGADADPLG